MKMMAAGNEKCIVYVDFPKTGLGNMLFIWARALVFARLNNLDMVVSTWWGLRWGALIRKERQKRIYYRYFKETSVWKRLGIKMRRRKKFIEPPLEMLSGSANKQVTYIFNTVMPDPDLFQTIRDHRQYISENLLRILHQIQQQKIMEVQSPVIGIHIRRGDFAFGSLITPLEFFIDGISIIRKVSGQNLPVTVFSDATLTELEPLLNLPGVALASKKADILDIIQLSRSRVMLLSSGSTFSYWGAFLSNAFVIRPETDWLVGINPSREDESAYTEMKWSHTSTTAEAVLSEKFSPWFLKFRHELKESVK